MNTNRDYGALLPKVLEALYPDEEERACVERRLSAYGKQRYHRDTDRVRVGILRLASAEPEKLGRFVDLACGDYRDLLCAAEYPLTSGRWGLREKDPEKHAKLSARERAEYEEWLAGLLGPA